MNIQFDEEYNVWLIVNDRGIATDEYATEDEARDAIIEAKRYARFERDAYGY